MLPFLALLAVLAVLPSAALANIEKIDCYKNTTVRGVGVPLSRCASNLVKDGLLCYPPCQSGFNGVGPVCWEVCPPGFVDTGAFCNPQIVSGDNSACHWYDKCGLTFDKGCVKCPAGMNTVGCLCSHPGSVFAKKSYGRGAGVPMVCAEGLQEDAGLCYPPCPSDKYKGVGPVCWASCPAGAFECGVICLDNSGECTTQMLSLSKAVVEMIGEIAACIISEGSECNVASLLLKLKELLGTLGIPACSMEGLVASLSDLFASSTRLALQRT
eukprot:CAMPEP_0177670978 /NCGR_PEP_ID=MMETSP0447-20121125/24410_1 /TAXON_ID=0 /ORGANISM="Stygamoeba regulata, Strain BSH-02190019" /LENGTH=269 /DNA_ID=CAMNT_0019178243 /DNA_START=54 /DNA_END=863 /DNA_ORIENTATION=-